MVKKIIFIFALVFLVGFVSAAGCCVSSDQRICSTNSERNSCEIFGGTFYNNDPLCSSVRLCDSGCCTLGLDSARMTRGECQVETQTRGFAAISFLQTEDDCNQYIVSQEWGACIGKNSYGVKTCSFVTRTQCAGEFFSDVLCSNVQNSGCNFTDNTVCFGNRVYGVDSCGNRDVLVEECDYSTGSVCTQSQTAGEFSAECVTANCVDEFDFSSFVIDDLYEVSPIYSSQERLQGETWCVTNGMVPFEDSELIRDLNVFGPTLTGTAGIRFYSRSCINGQIVTEACADGKEGYCSGESNWEDPESIIGTGGKCVSNPIRECVSAENEEDCNTENCFWFAPETMVSKSSEDMIEDLDMGKCLPLVSGGSTDSATLSSALCSMGNYETTFSFTNSMKRLAKKSNSYWGNTGLLLGGESSWEIKSTSSLTSGDVNLYLSGGMASLVSKGKLPFIILNPEAVALLEYRCSRIADCTGKMNWVGEYGRNSSGGVDFMTSDEIKEEFIARDISFSKDEQALLDSYLRSTGLEEYDLGTYPTNKFPILFGSASKKTLDMTFRYQCIPRKAPLEGDCSQCSEGGNICSNYICTSLGANCEYFNLGNFGTCENKGDISPPIITLDCPDSSSIGIQQPVKIGVQTSEVSECKFSLESASALYDTMSYDLGKSWGTEHETILTVPGYNQLFVGEATQYPLLLKSGEYNLYVRCIDPKGNGDSEPPKLCSFNVPKTPDKNPPVVLSANPKSNTPILFNSTTQDVTILVNEPSECKWSLKNEDFDSMVNEFDCRRDLVFRESASGYECSALLTNVTKDLGKDTKFYIRCKDQPDLEGEETDVYFRNKNSQSFSYVLRPSAKLEIVEISPTVKVTLGPNFANWNLSVKTKGGGYDGVTECKWKLDYKNYSTAFSPFATTQSTYKTQSINQKTEGDYTISVICADDSGNTASYSGPLSIRYDRISPILTRVYNDKGSLKIVTNEPAICKFTSVFSLGFGCAFTIAHPNLTSMVDTSNIEHTTEWKKGNNYFVKCQDYYGNENSICGMIGKAV